jgi:hypothetical protein
MIDFEITQSAAQALKQLIEVGVKPTENNHEYVVALIPMADGGRYYFDNNLNESEIADKAKDAAIKSFDINRLNFKWRICFYSKDELKDMFKNKFKEKNIYVINGVQIFFSDKMKDIFSGRKIILHDGVLHITPEPPPPDMYTSII